MQQVLGRHRGMGVCVVEPGQHHAIQPDRAVNGELLREVSLTTRRHDPLAQQDHGLGRRPGQGVELTGPDKGPL